MIHYLIIKVNNYNYLQFIDSLTVPLKLVHWLKRFHKGFTISTVWNYTISHCTFSLVHFQLVAPPQTDLHGLDFPIYTLGG